MKTALNAWSVEPGASFEKTFSEVSNAGFDGIELNVDKEGAHALTPGINDERLDEIAGLSEKYSLPVISISTSLWGANMGLGTPEAFERSERLLDCQLRCAKRLGARGVLTVPGANSASLPLTDAYRNCRETLARLGGVIEKYGLFVGVENVWNGFFTSPFDMARFVDETKNDRICAYYDIGNTLAFSRTEDWIEILASRIQFAHIKGFRPKSGFNSGGEWVDISACGYDWTRVRRALDDIGYDGYVTGEVSRTDPAMSWRDFYAQVQKEISNIIK